RPIDGLAVYNGDACTHDGGRFYTRRLRTLKYEQLFPAHGKKARQHRAAAPLLQRCKLQTYFTGKGWIRYFAVMKDTDRGTDTTASITALKSDLLQDLEQDIRRAEEDLEEQARVVQDFGDSRSARAPWLKTLDFPGHLRGLKDDAIKVSYTLSPKRVLDGDVDENDDAEHPDLVWILNAAEAMLQDAYELCSDTSPGWRMIQQRANMLNEFYAGGSGNSAGFRCFNNASTLPSYFANIKQLLIYFFRVV
ncbi:hypothetical protein B0J13DRAFT_408939, partial [Dactylonectria estremocensis]